MPVFNLLYRVCYSSLVPLLPAEGASISDATTATVGVCVSSKRAKPKCEARVGFPCGPTLASLHTTCFWSDSSTSFTGFTGFSCSCHELLLDVVGLGLLLLVEQLLELLLHHGKLRLRPDRAEKKVYSGVSVLIYTHARFDARGQPRHIAETAKLA